jgi:ribosomal protein S1
LNPEEFAQAVAQLDLVSGKEIMATAVNVDDEFAQLDVDGVLVLLNKKDASWKALGSCRDVLSEGDEVRVRILSVSAENREIEVGLKQVTEIDPWPDIAARYPTGTQLHGKVVRVERFGVFVELQHGVEGFVHETSLRLAGYEYADFEKTVVPGQTLYVVVRRVYRGKGKIALDLLRVAEGRK